MGLCPRRGATLTPAVRHKTAERVLPNANANISFPMPIRNKAKAKQPETAQPPLQAENLPALLSAAVLKARLPRVALPATQIRRGVPKQPAGRTPKPPCAAALPQPDSLRYRPRDTAPARKRRVRPETQVTPPAKRLRRQIPACPPPPPRPRIQQMPDKKAVRAAGFGTAATTVAPAYVMPPAVAFRQTFWQRPSVWRRNLSI